MKYRIAHISDLHLGYASGRKKNDLGINIREQDGYNAYNEVLGQIIENKVDMVLCTGDFFHKPNPTIRTIKEGLNGLSKLTDNNIPFYNLAGNHDATDNLTEYPANIVLHNEYAKLFSYTEPYKVVEVTKNIFIHFVSHHGYIEQQETMNKIKLIDNAINILATHGSCYDTNLGIILHTESSPREIIIPQSVMDMNWDYTFLGHIHERGWVSSKDNLTDTAQRKQFYGGSLIRRGFADKECKLGRGWTLWEIDTETKEFTPTFFTIKQRPQYDINIDVENLSTNDIEEKILKSFENIFKDIPEINEDTEPIVRINIIGITPQQRITINWKLFNEYILKCLIFNFKLQKKEEIEKTQSKLNNKFSYNLQDAYNEYWETVKDFIEKDLQDNTKKESSEFLEKGQEIVFNNK